MLNVIVLEAVEKELIRRRLAHKILSVKTNFSYTHLLELLKDGGVEYVSTEKKEVLEDEIFELNKLGVKYKIIQREVPEKKEPPKQEKKEEAPPPASPSDKQPSGTATAAAKLPTKDEFLNSAKSRLTQNKDLHDLQTKIIVAQKKKNFLAAFFTIVFLIAIVALLSFVSQQQPQSSQRQMPQREAARQSQQRAQNPPQAQQNRQGGQQNQNQSQNQSQREARAQFNQALDNANNACVEGAIDMEGLYRVAISFNRQNLQAWFGLLHCFEKKGDSRKAAEIRSEMQKLFGADVFTASQAVSAYGDAERFSMEGKVFRLSYLRKSNSASVEQELFSIGQGIADKGGFDRAVVFAKEGESGGYMISFSLADFPRNIEEFRQKITINRVDN